MKEAGINANSLCGKSDEIQIYNRHLSYEIIPDGF